MVTKLCSCVSLVRFAGVFPAAAAAAAAAAVAAAVLRGF